MALDAATTALLQGLAEGGRPPLHESTPEEARARGALLTALIGPGPDVASVEDVAITGADGASFTLRVVRAQDEPRGIVVYFHGGGWVLGDLAGHDTLARTLATRTGCTVVLVDYRLAPEHPYPVPVEDSWSALTWVDAHRSSLAPAGAPLVVVGDSAGGNLAAVMTQRARERGGPAIDHQVLVYPITDADLDRPSYTAAENQALLDRQAMTWFFDHYTGDRDVRQHPEVSPLRAADLSGLPPATVLLAPHDPLHDEGAAYAAALAEAGVAVDTRTVEGQAHGFFTMLNILPGAAVGMDYVVGRIASVTGSAVTA